MGFFITFIVLLNLNVKNVNFTDAQTLSHFVSVHSGYGVEVCGVRDPSMHDENLVVDHRGQRQPAEDLLKKLKDLLAVNLQPNIHIGMIR